MNKIYYCEQKIVLFGMESRDHERDRRDPGLDDKLEELLGDAPLKEENPKHTSVVLPIEYWENMKAQNTAILNELRVSQTGKKTTWYW